ncbi:MAG TPA: hypothetical protein VGH19_05030 [Verrucomicrobiae bacterium]
MHKQKQPSRHLALLCLWALLFSFSGCTSRSNTTAPIISVANESTYMLAISKKSGKRIIPGYDIFADGKCSLRSSEGDEFTLKLPPEEVTGLVSFSKEQGFFSISNESLEKASYPITSIDLQLVTNEISGVVSVEVIGATSTYSMETHANQVTVSIQDGTVKNSISRYNLHKEIKHYTNLTQFQIIGRCVDKIDETVLTTWKKQLRPLTEP